MAKRARFPLEMEQGVQVRSMEELREKFSLSRVMVYLSNGKLVTWLRDRYADDIAEQIEELSLTDKELPKRICEVFEVPYDEKVEVDLEKARLRNDKLNKLKQYTTEEKYLSVIDIVAFDQDDLYDLIDEGESTIYLCGERFSIPLAKKNMSYYGINNPIVIIDSKKEVDWQEKNISLVDVIYDEKYQIIIDNKIKTKEEPYKKVSYIKDDINGFDDDTVIIGDYTKKSYISFMLNTEDKKIAEECYNTVRNKLRTLNYDTDNNIKELKNMIKASGLAGLADNYINNL